MLATARSPDALVATLDGRLAAAAKADNRYYIHRPNFNVLRLAHVCSAPLHHAG